jgi:hypothetical protein
MSDSYFSQRGALHRRTFLRVAGASAATVSLVLAGCGTDTPAPTVDVNTLSLGSNDTGLLNYLYLLEQLKTAFYQKVVDAPPSDLRAGEKAHFDDLRDLKLVHRETLRYVVGTDAFDKAFEKPLPFDFSTLTLTTRAGVLAAAQQFEDLGVAASTGAMRLLTTLTTVSLLAKMVSVQARHAALVRDLRTPGSFAGDDVVISAPPLQSISISKTPVQVVAETKAFFLPIVVSTSSLPTA